MRYLDLRGLPYVSLLMTKTHIEGIILGVFTSLLRSS